MHGLRHPVKKGQGVTASERYFANLAERSFLNLWSYPNPFRDQKVGGRRDGKELCDLLVVCKPYIIIFSEKNIQLPDCELNVAWCRWFKRAVLAAAKQSKGAERWTKTYPEKIFLDRKCENPIPINFPSPENKIIHRVAVAGGSAEVCKNSCLEF